ncbi:MAG: hypothetical protein GXP25_15565 [Planctomycetes bacterium]|nr:hypothetical protein [Planctomycetota bacterium]
MKTVSFGLAVVFLLASVEGGLFAQSKDVEKRLSAFEKQLNAALRVIKEQDKKIKEQAAQLKRLEEKESPGGKIDEAIGKYLKEQHIEKPDAVAGAKKGKFYIESADGLFKIGFFGRVQLDFRGFEGGPIEPWGGHDFHNNFFLRRVRLGMAGYMHGKPNKFKVQADITHDQVHIRDGYMELAYVPWLKVRFGHFKPPFARQQLQSSKYITMIERALPVDNLSPERDYGIMAHGDLFDGTVQYGTGIFQGADGDHGDNNDAADWVYRLNFKPFKHTKNPWLEGFELGHGFTIGNQPLHRGFRGRTATDVDFFNPGSVAAFTDPTGSTNVQVHGTRTRATVDGAWYIGPFGLQWAYIHADEERGHTPYVAPGFASNLGSLESQGWYVETSYLLTGEKKSSHHVKPKHNFDPLGGTGWGAWEIATRIGQVEYQSRDNLFNYTYTDSQGNVITQPFKHQQNTAFTFAVNWYLNPHTRIGVNWVHNIFDERLEAPERDLDTVLARFQIYW